MSKQRIRAFTLIEVTITMLITAILIGITYTSYSIIVKSYRSFTAKNDDMAVLVNLDHLLKRDFERADIILKDTLGLTIKKDDKLIKYEFMPDLVIRNAGRIDTFKIQTQDVIATFQNIKIDEPHVTEEGNRVDDLSFTLLFNAEKIPYNYHKQYSSVNLIQRNPDALN